MGINRTVVGAGPETWVKDGQIVDERNGEARRSRSGNLGCRDHDRDRQPVVRARPAVDAGRTRAPIQPAPEPTRTQAHACGPAGNPPRADLARRGLRRESVAHVRLQPDGQGALARDCRRASTTMERRGRPGRAEGAARATPQPGKRRTRKLAHRRESDPERASREDAAAQTPVAAGIDRARAHRGCSGSGSGIGDRAHEMAVVEHPDNTRSSAPASRSSIVNPYFRRTSTTVCANQHAFSSGSHSAASFALLA